MKSQSISSSPTQPVADAAAVRAFYDDLHAAETFDSPPGFYAFILRCLGLRPDHRLLDVGCGTGGFLAAAAPRGSTLAGVDISPEAVEATRRRVPESDLRVGSGCELPWEDGSFDRVACLGTLEHLPDPVEGAREIGRVLVPDGRGVIYVPNTYYWRIVLRTIRFGTGPDEGQIIQRTGARKEWEELLTGAGLRVLAVRTWRAPLQVAPWRPKALLGSLVERLVPENLLLAFAYLVGPPRER